MSTDSIKNERDKLNIFNKNTTKNYADNLSTNDKDYAHLTTDDNAPVKIALFTDIPIVRVTDRPYLGLRIMFNCQLRNDFTTNNQFPLP